MPFSCHEPESARDHRAAMTKNPPASQKKSRVGGVKKLLATSGDINSEAKLKCEQDREQNTRRRIFQRPCAKKKKDKYAKYYPEPPPASYYPVFYASFKNSFLPLKELIFWAPALNNATRALVKLSSSLSLSLEKANSAPKLFSTTAKSFDSKWRKVLTIIEKKRLFPTTYAYHFNEVNLVALGFFFLFLYRKIAGARWTEIFFRVVRIFSWKSSRHPTQMPREKKT